MGNIITNLIPLSTKKYIASKYFDRLLHKNLEKLVRESKSGKINNDTISNVIKGWSNRGWSTDMRYISAIIKRINGKSIEILECGSGISSIIMGIVSPNSTIFSLEHIPVWGDKIRGILNRYNVKNVNIVQSQIVEYNNFCWYDISSLPDATKFQLVVCDGPPSDTPGGRFGLLPVMKDAFEDGTVILLDDTVREEEREVMRRWKKEFDCVTHTELSDLYGIISIGNIE